MRGVSDVEDLDIFYELKKNHRPCRFDPFRSSTPCMLFTGNTIIIDPARIAKKKTQGMLLNSTVTP
jgi:hypothetical protein